MNIKAHSWLSKLGPGWKEAGLFVFLCALFGLLSVRQGQDVGWDLLNYHLYNPFAFLTGRFTKDIMPASIHTFLNPLPDIPYYLLIKYFNHYPRLVAFIMGIPGGVLAFFIYKLSWFFLGKWGDKMAAWCALAVGASGAMLLSQLGMTFNEVPLAALMCAALYLLLKFLFENKTIRWAFWAAFIAGATAGLKYTAAPFVVGLTAIFFANLYFLPERKKSFYCFALGGIAGFLVMNGFFMARLWITYGNPFFPFLNGIFHSPFFDPINFDEIRFYPRNFLQGWFYPFFWITTSDGLVTEPRIFVADARLALAYLSTFFLTVSLAWAAWRQRVVWPQPRVREAASLILFVVVSYIIWLRVYSVLRYAVVLEALSGIVVLLALRRWLRPTCVAFLGILLVGACWFTTEVPNWRRASYGKQVIEFDRFPTVEPNALIVYYQEGLAFMSMFFPPDAQFIGGVKLPINDYPTSLFQAWAQKHNVLPPGYYGYHFEEVSKQKIAAHDGPIYIVETPWFMMFSPQTLSPYGLTRSAWPDCVNFNSNLNVYSGGWQLCRVEKMAASSSEEKTF